MPSFAKSPSLLSNGEPDRELILLKIKDALLDKEACIALPEIKEYELIAQQALEIANLKAEVARMEADRRSIYLIIYGCGGPLNDNVKGYTKTQMYDFRLIAQHIE